MIWLISILGFVLRVLNLNQSLWLDEASQTILSQTSINNIFFGRLGDVHPPLSFIFYHFWLIFGTSEVWIRLLPVLFGVATIPLIYLLTKDMLDKRVAILSAFFLAVAPFHVYYSQEIRMYSMLTFFATLSMYFLYKQKWLWFALSSVAMIYIHHVGFLVILTQLIYVAFLKKSQLLSFIKWFGLIILLWLPWLPIFFSQLKNGGNPDQYLPGWGSILSLPLLKTIPETLVKFEIGRISFDNIILYFEIALIVSLVFIYLVSLGIKNLKKDSYLLVFWLILPIVLGILISLRLPLYEPQRMIMVLPVFYILLAFGISNLKRFQKLAICLVITVSLTSLSIYYLNQKFWREDWRFATAFVNNNSGSQTAALFVWPQSFDPYIWYGGKNGVGLVKKFPASSNEISLSLGKLKDKNEIYLFEYLQDLSDPQKITQQTLTKDGYIMKQQYDFRGVGFVDLYQKP